MNWETNFNTLISPRWLDRPVNIRGSIPNQEPPIIVNGKTLTPGKIPAIELPDGLPKLPTPIELQRDTHNVIDIKIPETPEIFKANASPVTKIALPPTPQIFTSTSSSPIAKPVHNSPSPMIARSAQTSPLIKPKSVHNSPAPTTLKSVHNSPAPTTLKSVHNSPLPPIIHRSPAPIKSPSAHTSPLPQISHKAAIPSPVAKELPKPPIIASSPTVKLKTPKIDSPIPKLKSPVFPDPATVRSPRVMAKLPPSQLNIPNPRLNRLPLSTDIASPPHLTSPPMNPQNSSRIHLDVRAPIASPKIEALRRPTIPILNNEPYFLDSPNPRVSVEPMVPEQNHIVFSSRTPDYIPPFIAINAQIPYSSTEPRVSFPPSPATGPVMLAPGSVEYEKKFIKLSRQFDNLKARKPQHADKIELPQRGEPIEVLEARLKGWQKIFQKEDKSFRWQAYLTAGFLFLEFISTRIHLPASGFTWSQWIIMCDYEEMLNEMTDEDEEHEFMKGHSTLTKLMTTAIFYFGMFVVMRWLISFLGNDKWAEELNKGVWQLMRGNPAAAMEEGPRMQDNPVARLLVNISTILKAGNNAVNGASQAPKPVPDKPQFAD